MDFFFLTITYQTRKSKAVIHIPYPLCIPLKLAGGGSIFHTQSLRDNCYPFLQHMAAAKCAFEMKLITAGHGIYKSL